MGIESVYISRVSDGLVLVASMDNQAYQAPSAPSASSLQKRTSALAVPNNAREGRELLLSLTSSSPNKCSVDGEFGLSYHYGIFGPIVVFISTDRGYPKKLAFCYIEEARQKFWEHVRREFPGQDESKVVLVNTDRPHAFVKFDRELKALKKDFQDPSSRKNLQRLQETLTEVTSIMRRNIDSVMERGKTLDDIRTQSQKLHEDSKSLAWGAKKLNYQAMLRRYGPFALAGLGSLFLLWVRFYVMF